MTFRKLKTEHKRGRGTIAARTRRLLPTVMALEGRALLSTITVSSVNDDGSAGTLRSAIEQANASNQADTIVFSSLFNTHQTINLSGGPLALTDTATTTISGPGANLLTINGAGTSRVFDIDGASAALSGVTISGGSADTGAGLRNDGGTLTLTGVTISGNTATAMGGGLATQFGGTTDLIGCTVSGNTAATGGGGLLIASSTVSMTNTTVADNTATTGSGGGLAISGGTTTLINVTVSANTAATSGGLSDTGGALALSNTIVAGNSHGDLSGTVSGGNGHNLIGGDPQLAPLGDYGGPFLTLALLPDSPAIGAGAPGDGVPTHDERGFYRGAAIDIGAFQSQGTTLVVNVPYDGFGSNSGQLSLRQAVNLANALATVDTITFDPETFGVPSLIRLTEGPLTLSNPATTTITGPGASLLTISGNHASRVFDISNGCSATISGLTVSDGSAATGGGLQNDGGTLVLTSVTITGNSTSGNSGGGGVYSKGGSTTLGNCTITGNTANNSSGGIYSYGGTLSLTSVTISSNTVTGALSQGGGVFVVEGTAILHGCTISENTAVSEGGGLRDFKGTVTLTSCSVSGNTAKNGAGLSNQYGTLNLTNVTVNGNQATSYKGSGYGGGVYNGYGAVTLANCSISGNTAKFGAGLYSGRGTNSITITNSTLSGNTASQQGGGLATTGTATLTGCTISGNSAPTAAGISTANSNNTLTLVNSTVSGNTASQTAGGIYSSLGTTTLVNVTVSANSAPSGGGIVNSANSATVTLTNTIVAGQKSGGDVSGNFTGDDNVIGVNNPLLAPLGDYGGPTQTMPLLPGSPASGAGASGAGIPTTDQRGQIRGNSVDVGAFQGEGTTLVVDTTTDGTGSGFGQLSLRQAINLVNAEPTADTIDFSPTVFQTPQTITLAGTELLLTNTSGATTITGPAAGVTVSGGGTSRVFEINSGVTVSMSGLTISGGHAQSGGGVHNLGGTLTMNDCTISNNTSTFGGGGLGGIGTLTMMNCTVSGNSAPADGGGLNIYGGTASLTSVTISDNSTTSFDGGGLAAFNCAVTLINCTVTGNSAAGQGGGVHNQRGETSLTLINCTVSENSAGSGGGVYNQGGLTMLLTNTIVAANSAATGIDVFGALDSSSANNLIGNGTGMSGISNGSQGNQVGTTQTPIDPLLSPLGNYGGLTQTQALLPGSPAIANGAAGTGVPKTDERGMPRTGHVDIGAFQSQGFTLTPVAGSTPQSAIIGQTFANPLAVTVVGVNPVEPVDGGIVTFVVNPNGGSSGGISGTIVTIEEGTASVSVTANNIPGNFTVSVSAIGAASPASFALTNTEVPSLLVNTTQDVVNSIDGTTSLREAIDYAMTLSTPSTITFSPAVFGTTTQTITLSLGSLPLANAATTTIVGPGASLLIISGNKTTRVFDVSGSAVLSGLTITQGQSEPDNGGGILNMHGTLTLADCTITGNKSDIGAGAGVYALDGTTTLSDCVVTGNTGSVGAGVSIEGGTATIANSTISTNTGANGGGLFVGQLGSVTITNSAITGNASLVGGGVCLEQGATATLTGCTLSGNTASNPGGQGGGGLASLEGSTVTMTNCTVSGNSAPDALGGGVYNTYTLSLINCTVSGNSATSGGGLYLKNSSTATLKNTIVAGQTGGGDVSGSYTGVGNLVNGIPGLAPLGDYGGPTPTMALLPGSPAIGGGTTGTGVPSTDQRGFARGTSIDIGAFQSQAATQVNTTVDGAGSGPGQLTLRQAVNFANAQPGGDTITFAPAVFANAPRTITLTSGPLSLTDKALTTITGPGANLVTVSGGGQSQVFNIAGGSATLSGLTISGGSAQNGGGFENSGGTLTLSNVIVSGNTATGNGGGIYTTSGGSTTLDGVTVSGNTAASGGGAAVGSGAVSTLTNVTVAGNTATGSGGGLADLGTTLTVINVTISNNQAASTGGGLLVSGSSANATLQNTIVAGNTGGNTSGGFAQASSLIGQNPLLAPLGDYGGPTPTMPLLPGSLAIGGGSKGFGVPTIDQRGLPRPSSQPIDIGAFQSQGFNIVPVKGSTPQSADVTDAFSNPLAVTVTAKNAVEPVNGGVVTFTLNSGTGASATLSAGTAVIASGQAAVTATANSTPGSYTVSASAAGAGTVSFALSNTEKASLRITTLSDVVNPFDNLTSLREAVAYANAHPGPDTIVFDPTVLGKRPRTIRLIGGPLVLTDPATTTIIGPGARRLTIKGNVKSHIFDIEGGSLALSGVTIIGGNPGKGTGGALHNDGGTLRLKHVIIRGNRARVGGGLNNDRAATLTNVVFRGNTADFERTSVPLSGGRFDGRGRRGRALE